jgi:SAM-dependent methyltransferase
MANMDDPATGRRMLTGEAYKDDRHIRTRMSIWAYAETRGSPRWRTEMIDWDGSHIVADVGCGNGFDLRQIRYRRAIGIDLSPGMLNTLKDLEGLSRVQADAQDLPLPDDCVDVSMAMHMLYHVPSIPAAVSELRRITRPGGTTLASSNSRSTMAEVFDLLDTAVSERVGRQTHAVPPLSFDIETGAELLEPAFGSVELTIMEWPLSFPSAEPVVAYLDSVRAPALAYVGEPLDFGAVLADVAAGVDAEIQRSGRFRTVARMGVFVCR